MAVEQRSADARRADSAEQELRDFSHIVAHDFTASLRHISEFSKLLIHDIGLDAGPSARAHGALVQSATEKCQHMIDAMLIYSRTQQTPLQYGRYNMKRLVDIAALQLSAEVGETKANICVEDMGECLVDADLITLAARLALENSIKFSRPGSSPRIHARGVRRVDTFVLLISDNGIGVAFERQEKMFRMFYRDHAEGVFPGVGAGLAICQRILRRHGGNVRFVAHDAGACLELSVPLARAALHAHELQ